VLDRKAFVAALIYVPNAAGTMCRMPSPSMRRGDPVHKIRKCFIGSRPKKHVPMIAHDAIPAHTHRKSLDALCEDIFKGNKVQILLEYPQPAVGTIKNVVRDTSFSYAFFPWHNKDNKGHSI
jgi:hypothetical protein